MFDGQHPSQSLYSGSLTLKADDQAFKVVADGRRVLVIPAVGR